MTPEEARDILDRAERNFVRGKICLNGWHALARSVAEIAQRSDVSPLVRAELVTAVERSTAIVSEAKMFDTEGGS